MEKNIERQRRLDILNVMQEEQQRGGVPYHQTPHHLHDEQPEGDFFELPRRWVNPPEEK